MWAKGSMKGSALVMILLCGFAISATSQDRIAPRGTTCRPHTEIIDSFRDFLAIFYPELKQRWTTLTVRQPYAFSNAKATERMYFVSASEEPPDCGPGGYVPGFPPTKKPPPSDKDCAPAAPAPTHKLFEGYFVVAENTHAIHNFGYSAPLPGDRLQTLVKTVREHPEWSDGDADKALERAGAKFRLHDEVQLLRTVPLSKLSKFWGPLRVRSVKFNVRSENVIDDAGNHDAEMLWEVRLKPIKASGKFEYSLSFEPFDGKLVGMGVRK